MFFQNFREMQKYDIKMKQMYAGYFGSRLDLNIKKSELHKVCLPKL